MTVSNSGFNAEDEGHSGLAPHGWKGSMRTKPMGKAKGRRKPKPDSLREQPIADSTGTVPCKLCGHPVDVKRMHFHMVRFHGAAMKSNGSQGPQSGPH